MSEGHPNRPIIDVIKRGKRPSEEFDPTKLHHSIMKAKLMTSPSQSPSA